MSVTRYANLHTPTMRQLKAWYRPEGLQSYANGAVIPTWADHSGNGNTVSISSDTFSPVCSGSALNGWNVCGFRLGNTSYLSGSTVISGTVARSIYLVAMARNANTQPFLDLQLTGPGQFFMVDCEAGIRTGAGGRRAWSAPPLLSYAVYTFRFPSAGTSADFDARINSVQLVQSAVSVGNPNTGVGVFALGAGAAAGSTRFDGNLAEVMIYQDYHSDSQATRHEAYLKGKFAL